VVSLDVEVLERTVVDEMLLLRLLNRAGRIVAAPALECLELLRDPATPPRAKVTVLAALTYLFVPLDLIPDLLPVAGFSDDLVALTTLLGTCWRHRTPELQQRVRWRLDRWFPQGR
jgi:uncharacterized membrane protein YkvA (DUF1232 family)